MKKLFSDNRGESLIESLVSVFILAILVLAITGVIIVSLRISNRAIENAGSLQNEWLNPLFRGDYDRGDSAIVNGVEVPVVTEGDIIFEFRYFADEANEIEIDVTVPILLYQHPTGGTWAFRPDEGGGP